MSAIRAADGGFMLNSNQFYYTKDEQKRPVLNVVHTETEPVVTTDFVIVLTEIEGQDGQYTADKAWVDIKAAYDNNENMIVTIDNAKLPMMNADITVSSSGEDEANIMFGFTQVTATGQIVFTRAVNYIHSADGDTWADEDAAAEYIKIDNGVAVKKIDLVRNSALTVSAVDGTYLLSACDEIHRGLVCAFVCGDTTTISAITGTPGWEVTKGAVANSLYINNKSDTAALNVNIIKI